MRRYTRPRESPSAADKLCAEFPWEYTGFRRGVGAQDSKGLFVFNPKLFAFKKKFPLEADRRSEVFGV